MAVDVRERASTGSGLPHPSGPDGWTVADLELLPDDGLRYELLDGTLLVSPAPNRRHQEVLSELVAVLRTVCPLDYRVLFAPLDWRPGGERSFQPDALVVPRGAAHTPVANPPILVEIASRSTATLDRTAKFNAYAEAGAMQYWIVDPGAAEDGSDCAVEVYDLVDGAYALQVRGVGVDAVSVVGPMPVHLVPAALTQ